MVYLQHRNSFFVNKINRLLVIHNVHAIEWLFLNGVEQN